MRKKLVSIIITLYLKKYNIEIAKTDMGELGEMKKSRETIKKIMSQRISKKVNKKFNKKLRLPNMGDKN